LDPPLPIPNRTVKRRYADDSAYFMCESRSPPGSPLTKPPTSNRRGLCAFTRRFDKPAQAALQLVLRNGGSPWLETHSGRES
jgi:hypothetical protein